MWEVLVCGRKGSGIGEGSELEESQPGILGQKRYMLNLKLGDRWRDVWT